MDVWAAVINNVAAWLWVAFAFVAMFLFRDRIGQAIERLTNFKAGPVEMTLTAKMDSAAEAAATQNRVITKSDQRVESTVVKPIRISERQRKRVLERAKRCAVVLKDKQILWIDDVALNNKLERELFEALGISIDQVQTNEEAKNALMPDGSGYNLIISDVARPVGQSSGADFLEKYRAWPFYRQIPIIFYVSKLEIDRSIPLGAFGITNRPDELLHLVIDALERRA